jgi:hypothetical protein
MDRQEAAATGQRRMMSHPAKDYQVLRDVMQQ